MGCRRATKAWQTFLLWLHPDAGWRTSTTAPVSLEAFAALLDSGNSTIGSEPRIRIRGDLIRMTTAVRDTLVNGAAIEDDFGELRWLRVLAPQASPANVTLAHHSPADGVVRTQPPGSLEMVTMRLTVAKRSPEVKYTVRYLSYNRML
jgi:hypothetical protein